MMNHNREPSSLITKLSAIWAVSESGLGGVLHALHVPFSGLILGSFAVIIITFIAKNTEQKFRTIIQTTLIVVLIKAIASPFSPITAYIAVLFQGILGAVIYQLIKPQYFSSIIFGIIALLESAFQKLFTLVLVFGNSIWEAFQAFFVFLANEFFLQSLVFLPKYLLFIYFIIYCIGGVFAGIFSQKLPQFLEKESHHIDCNSIKSDQLPNLKKKKKNTILLFVSILSFIVFVFVFSGSFHKAMYSLFRTFAALILIYFVVNPLFKSFLSHWKKNQQLKNTTLFNDIVSLMPSFKNNATFAYQLVEKEPRIFIRIKKFLLNWLLISLYCDEKSK